MPTLIGKDNKLVTFDSEDEAQNAFQSGHYGFPDAEADIPFVNPDGSVVTYKAADAEQAFKGGARLASKPEQRKAWAEQEYGGLKGTAIAAASGFAGAATLGLSDVATRAIDPEAEQAAAYSQLAHPIVSGGAKLAGFVAPLLATGGSAAPEELAAGGALEGAEGAAGAEGLVGGLKGAGEGAGATEGVGGAVVEPPVPVPGQPLPPPTINPNAPVVPEPPTGAFGAEADAARAVDANQALDAAAQAKVTTAASDQVVANASQAVRPPPTMAQQIAAYTPVNLSAKGGEAVAKAVGDLLGNPQGAIGQIAKTIAKTAASGALEGGLYGLADQMSEDALGDHDLNADHLYAAFGQGLLSGAELGGALGGLGGAAEVTLQKIGRTGWIQRMADRTTFDALKANGGNVKKIIREGIGRDANFAENLGNVVNKPEYGVNIGAPIDQVFHELDGNAKNVGQAMDNLANDATVNHPGVLAEDLVQDMHQKETVKTALEQGRVTDRGAPKRVVTPSQADLLGNAIRRELSVEDAISQDAYDLRQARVIEQKPFLTSKGNDLLSRNTLDNEYVDNEYINERERRFLENFGPRAKSPDVMREAISPEELQNLNNKGFLQVSHTPTAAAKAVNKYKLTTDHLVAMANLARSSEIGIDEVAGSSKILKDLANKRLINASGTNLTIEGRRILEMGIDIARTTPETQEIISNYFKHGRKFGPEVDPAMIDKLAKDGYFDRTYHATPAGYAAAGRPVAGSIKHLSAEDVGSIQMIRDLQSHLKANPNKVIEHLPDNFQSLADRGLVGISTKVSSEGKHIANYLDRSAYGKILQRIRDVADPETGRIAISDLRKLRQEFDTQIPLAGKASIIAPGVKDLYLAGRQAIESKTRSVIKEVAAKTGRPELFTDYESLSHDYKYLDAGRKLAKAGWAAKLANKKSGPLQMGLAVSGGILGAHFGPVGSAIGIASGLKSRGATSRVPGLAASALKKLSRFGIIDHAGTLGKREASNAAERWFSRNTETGASSVKGVSGVSGVSSKSYSGAQSTARASQADIAHDNIAKLQSMAAQGPIDVAKVDKAFPGLAQYAPKTAASLATKMNATLQYLLSIIPKDHSDYSNLGNTAHGHLSSVDYHDFNEEFSGATNPIGAIQAVGDGTATRAKTKGAKKGAPDVWGHFQQQVMQTLMTASPKMPKLTPRAQFEYSNAFGVPAGTFFTPSGVQLLQSDRSTVAGSPNSKMGGNKMGATHRIKNSLGGQLETSVQKVENIGTPGRKNSTI